MTLSWPRLPLAMIDDSRLQAHLASGDRRLAQLHFDPDPALCELWDFVLSENERLAAHRTAGRMLLGALKDLGTVPLLGEALGMVTFYPDGAFWTPCLMELSDGLLARAARLGLGPELCPVRAALPALLDGDQFPLPDLLVAGLGGTCDDVAALVARLGQLGREVLRWELPAAREAEPGEAAVTLPSGGRVPEALLRLTARELRRVAAVLARRVGRPWRDEDLVAALERAAALRAAVRRIRDRVLAAPQPPLGPTDLLLIELLAVHWCSDAARCARVLADLEAMVDRRLAAAPGPDRALRLAWINPPADLRCLELIGELDCRLVAADFMLAHAWAPAHVDPDPFLRLAAIALDDPLVGPLARRAERLLAAARAAGAEGLVHCRIPGASHCPHEGPALVRACAATGCDLPMIDIEVPPIMDAAQAQIRTRLEALVEIMRAGQRPSC